MNNTFYRGKHIISTINVSYFLRIIKGQKGEEILDYLRTMKCDIKD